METTRQENILGENVQTKPGLRALGARAGAGAGAGAGVARLDFLVMQAGAGIELLGLSTNTGRQWWAGREIRQAVSRSDWFRTEAGAGHVSHYCLPAFPPSDLSPQTDLT